MADLDVARAGLSLAPVLPPGGGGGHVVRVPGMETILAERDGGVFERREPRSEGR
jgi:hypothetical protein